MTIRRRLLISLFNALYTGLAPVYDAVSRAAFAGEWARWQEIAVGLVDRPPVVELGCGTGRAQTLLRAAGLPSIGIDLALPMLRQARHRAPGRCLQARAARLPLRSASVGTLLAIFPTDYILDPATWREAERVLRPGGRLVVALHGWLTPDGPRRRLLMHAHRLLYGHGAGLPSLPDTHLPALSLLQRSRHGFVAIAVATRPNQPAAGGLPRAP